jgi:two-component system, LytTR family, response regulator
MIRIAAVDDEIHVLERFQKIVSENKEFKLCGLFETGEELLSYLKGHPLEVVFLDIEMPGESGLQLSEKILAINEEINIIFITAFNQYAVEAFELEAIDYILKPFTEERLNKTLRRLLRKKGRSGRAGKPFIQCFGGFEVFQNEEALVWKNSKAKEILAFLVHKEGISVSWEKIATAVWPEFDSEKAQTNFHATTYLLRKKLAEAGISYILESGRGNYRVLTDQVDCDLYKLEELIKGNKFIRKEDVYLLQQFLQKGYLEEEGYAWTYQKAAELESICRLEMNI